MGIIWHTNRSKGIRIISGIHADAKKEGCRIKYGVYLVAAAILLILAYVGYTWKGTAPNLEPVTIAQTDSYEIKIESDSYPAKVLQSNRFQVTMTQDEQPVENAIISITLWMPRMLCGELEVETKQIKPGVYEGEGIPLMPGLWNADVQIRLDDQNIEASHRFEAVR